MIDVDKVRLWTVRFLQPLQLAHTPYPGMIVEEVEEKGYYMPQCSTSLIPIDIGGQITIILEGKGILEVGRKQFELVPGTAFLYQATDPDVAYYYPRNAKDKWRFVWISLVGEASTRIIAEINRTYGYYFNVGIGSELEKRLLSYQKYAGTTTFQTPMEAAQMVFEMLNLLCKTDENPSHLSKNSRRIRDVQNEMQNAFNESISTSTLAGKMGISREHLSKTFHNETGRTLRDYREEQRLNEAFTLLLKSNFSCKEIAFICHYGSYSSFFRSFKKHYHFSPELFRKKNI